LLRVSLLRSATGSTIASLANRYRLLGASSAAWWLKVSGANGSSSTRARPRSAGGSLNRPIVGGNNPMRACGDIGQRRAGSVEIAADAEAGTTGREEFGKVVRIGAPDRVDANLGRQHGLDGLDSSGSHHFGGKHLKRACTGPDGAKRLCRGEDARIGAKATGKRAGDHGFISVGRNHEGPPPLHPPITPS